MRHEPAERWRRVADLVDAVLEREPATRAGYLAQACAGEPVLRIEVESMLSLAGAPSFLDTAAVDFAAPLLGVAADEDRSTAPASVPAHVHTEPGAAYELEREIGRGGMATVYLARDAKHGRRVAVKVLDPRLTTLVGAEDFVREIRLTARLQHPHILGLIDSGVFDPEAGSLAGRPYYTMPYVEGESLRARLARGNAPPFAEAVRLLREMADALCYAHEQGVVHRDVKPENILLSRGHAVVADFGIATALVASRANEGERVEGTTAESGTSALLGAVLGTPAYMSPEQAAGRTEVDHRADLYAWGVVAYELLSGRHPFSGKPSRRALLEAHIGETPQSLWKIAPAIPTDLAALVMRCLAKDPAERPGSGAEILAALDATGLAASRPTGPGRSVPRWIPLAALPALALLLVLGALEARAPRADGWSERLRILVRGGASPHTVTVVGTGDPAVDIPGVQAAVDRGDTVVLKGRFSFDASPTKPIALPLASGWFPTAAEILVAKSVVITGVRDARGEMPTIDGGTIPFYVDAPRQRVVILGVRFVRSISRAIVVYAVRGVEIGACRFEGMVPFAGVGEAISIDSHGGIPTPPSPGNPENISGRLLIDRNEIDATGGSAHDGTAGIGVFSVGQSPGREVQLDIIGNLITNTSTSTIIIRRVAGRVRVLGNTLRTSREVGSWGTDAVRLVNTGSYLMANNTIECRWADCVGLAVFSQFAEWPIERAVVEDNDVLMSPPTRTVFSDSSTGIEVRGFARDNLIRRNALRGRARVALSMDAFRGGIPADNQFIDNRFDQFAAALADIFVGKGIARRRIVGAGTIADQGGARVVER